MGFNHEKLNDAGISHEFVLVEWAPPTGRPLLTDLMRAAFPAMAKEHLTCYVVDARYQQACSLNPRLDYLEFVAKNVGIRRACGSYVLSTNTDVYLGRRLVDMLHSRAVSSQTVHCATRTEVKLGGDYSHVDWDVLEDSRNHDMLEPAQPLPSSRATGDFLLLDRKSFHDLRGFNEVYRLTRRGIDANFLVKAFANGYPITHTGYPVYHVSHADSFRVSASLVGEDRPDAPCERQRWYPREVVYENPESWGLADAPERPLRDRAVQLDFAWAAVPPLADLRRVVLPAARTRQANPIIQEPARAAFVANPSDQ